MGDHDKHKHQVVPFTSPYNNIMAQNFHPITDVSSIPTISDLYKSSHLHPSPAYFPPSSTLNSKVSIVQASITNLAVTSIVNAANKSLLGGGGVDGAIHAGAGLGLLAECRTLGGCITGSAKITGAYNLPSKHIIHAVGPIYQNPEASSHLLEGCYRTSLELAAEKGGSVAFSCISTGIYGYPSLQAAEIATREVRRFLEDQENNGGDEGKRKLDRVVFCLFEDKDVRAYEKWVPKIFPPTSSELRGASSSNPTSDSKNSDATPDPDQIQTKAGPTEPISAHDQSPEDWETVEKPDDSATAPASELSDEGVEIVPAAAHASDFSDEGVEVDAVDSDLAASAVSEKEGNKAKKGENGGGSAPTRGLLKDW